MNDENTFSENFSKKKRGRPPKFSEPQIKDHKKINPDLLGKTNRHIQNYIYTVRPFCILDRQDPKREKYSWLIGKDENGTGIKRTILSELGRLLEITDAAYIIQLSDYLCETKPKTQEVVFILRKIRRNLQNGESI